MLWRNHDYEIMRMLRVVITQDRMWWEASESGVVGKGYSPFNAVLSLADKLHQRAEHTKTDLSAPSDTGNPCCRLP